MQDIGYSKPIILINYSKFILNNFLYDGKNNTGLDILKFWFPAVLSPPSSNNSSLSYSENNLTLSKILESTNKHGQTEWENYIMVDMNYDKINIINEDPLIISSIILDTVTYYKKFAYLVAGLDFKNNVESKEIIFAASLYSNLEITYDEDVQMSTGYIKNLIEPLLVLFMMSPPTTRYLFTFFSFSPDEINNYVHVALSTLANINKFFVTKSFKLEKIKKEDRDIALLDIQNINERFMKKFYYDDLLYKTMVDLIVLNQNESEQSKHWKISLLLRQIPEFILSNRDIFIDKNFVTFLK